MYILCNRASLEKKHGHLANQDTWDLLLSENQYTHYRHVANQDMPPSSGQYVPSPLLSDVPATGPPEKQDAQARPIMPSITLVISVRS